MAALCLLLCIFALSCVRTASAQGLGCTICQLIVGEVEKIIAANATESEVLQKLGDACIVLADPKWVAECKTLVNEYGPDLIQHIINKEPPNVACAAVGLCSNSSITTFASKTTITEIQSKSGSIGCAVCTYLVGIAENYVANNSSESDILGFFEHDCELLGIKTWVETCQGTVATFGPEIIQLVMNKQPADVVCKEIKLCNSSSVAATPVAAVITPAAPVAGGNDTIPCELCEMLVDYTEKAIAANKTEGEIIDDLNKVCTDIPVKSWATDCTNMVVEYGDAIIAYLVNEEPPEVVCTELHLCSSSSSSSFRPKVTLHKQ